MKKVPTWIRKVIAFCNKYPCADTREKLMNELESGSFDYDSFVRLCRDSHIAFYENGVQHEEAFSNKWEAIEAVGKNGRVQSMQGVLHEIFNNE
ncbi:MAG: hypothetical protein KatS3mg035_1023 [Bacteroidia bacterium]|nr:MAG: hypothetical protein KatS3mg035_1023 [Bacteroidia bacterium]